MSIRGPGGLLGSAVAPAAVVATAVATGGGSGVVVGGGGVTGSGTVVTGRSVAGGGTVVVVGGGVAGGGTVVAGSGIAGSGTSGTVVIAGVGVGGVAAGRVAVAADLDPDRVDGRGLVRPGHHRGAVRAVTGPRGALQGAGGGGGGARDVDRDRVGPGAAGVVLGGQEERRRAGRVRGLVRVRQDPAGGVEVAALQAGAVQHRALQVVATGRGTEEPVADQVAGADLELEALADADGLRRGGDQQGGQLVLRGDRTHRGRDAGRVGALEARVELQRVLTGRGAGLVDLLAAHALGLLAVDDRRQLRGVLLGERVDRQAGRAALVAAATGAAAGATVVATRGRSPRGRRSLRGRGGAAAVLAATVLTAAGLATTVLTAAGLTTTVLAT